MLLTTSLLRSATCRNLRRFLASGCSTYRQVRLRGPSRPGRGPQSRPLRAPWVRIQGAATTAMSLHRRGAATTKTGPCRRKPGDRSDKWPSPGVAGVRPLASRAGSQAAKRRRNPSGRWGSWPISVLLVVDDARASTSSSRLDLGSRDPSADDTGGPGPGLWVVNTTSHDISRPSLRDAVRSTG